MYLSFQVAWLSLFTWRAMLKVAHSVPMFKKNILQVSWAMLCLKSHMPCSYSDEAHYKFPKLHSLLGKACLQLGKPYSNVFQKKAHLHSHIENNKAHTLAFIFFHNFTCAKFHYFMWNSLDNITVNFKVICVELFCLPLSFWFCLFLGEPPNNIPYN